VLQQRIGLEMLKTSTPLPFCYLHLDGKKIMLGSALWSDGMFRLADNEGDLS